MNRTTSLNKLIYRCIYVSIFVLIWLWANQSVNALQGKSATVKHLDDDSQLTLLAEPSELWPDATNGNGHTKFTGRLYYHVSSAHVVAWKLSILAGEGNEVNSFTGSMLVQPKHEIVFSQDWDGTDSQGRKLAPGIYQGVAIVRLAPKRSLASNASFDDIPSLVRKYTEARFATFVSLRYRATTEQARRGDIQPQATPNEPGFPYNFYYGTLHSQTRFTDGGHPNDSTCASSTTHAAGDFDPTMAYNYAQNTAHIDFLGISDHNHFFDNACSGCTSAQVIQRYHDGLNAAAAANVDGTFVAIYAMEWGYIATVDFPMEGHVNLYEIPKLFGWESGFYEVFTDPAGSNYPAMYTAAKNNPSVWGSIGGFNHPATTNGGDFDGFSYTTDGDDVICTSAVISGPATGFSTTQADTGNRYAGPNKSMYPSWATYDTYNRILGAGFHVAPVADADVHCSNYGTSTHDRTVILATSLTKANIMDALKNRRVFATSDANVQLVYTMIDSSNVTHYMGEGSIRTQGPVQVSGQITLHVSVFDPDAGETVSSIKIYEPVPNNTSGQSTLIASGTTSPFDFTFTPPSGNHAYYVYVTMSTGAEVWSAPIWINATAVATPDFSISATPSSQTVAPGASANYTVTVTASGGFTGTVILSASGLPAGATASFNPASVAASGSSTMTVTTDVTTPNGTFPLTITGASGTLQHTASVSLVVVTPDFSISATPSSQTVTTGASANYTVTVTASGGFTGTVTLSASGLPAGATASFNPASVAASGSSTMAVATDVTTPTGTFPLTITGTSGTLQHTTSVSLVVTAPPPPDTTAPTAPSNLTATTGPAKKQISLSWTASTDNVGVSGYQIYRSTSGAIGTFAQVATSTTTSYADKNLTSGATYYYYVQATDAAGNFSSQSNTASAKAK